MVDERIAGAIDNDHTAAAKDFDGQKAVKKKGSTFTDSEEAYMCVHCMKLFKSHLIYRKHLKIHSDKSFVCPICGKSFVHKHYLQTHMVVHGKSQYFQCPLCQKRFTQKGNLNQHMKFHTSKKSFVCEICGKDFYQQEHLKAHLRLHNNERPFSCEVCSKSFNIKSSLQRHMNCHTGARPFICDICHRGYSRRSVMMLHIQQVHENKKPFQCSECQLCFSQKGNLQAHFRRKHLHPKPEKKTKSDMSGSRQGNRKQTLKQNGKAGKSSYNTSISVKSKLSKPESMKDSRSPKASFGVQPGPSGPICAAKPEKSAGEDSLYVRNEKSSTPNTSFKEHIGEFEQKTTKLNGSGVDNGDSLSILESSYNLLGPSENGSSSIDDDASDLPNPSVFDSSLECPDDLKPIADFGTLLGDTKGWEDYILDDPDNLLSLIPHYDMSDFPFSPSKISAIMSKPHSDLGDDLFSNLPSFCHDYASSSPLFDSELDVNDISLDCSKNSLDSVSPKSSKKERNIKIQDKKNKTDSSVRKASRKSINFSVYESQVHLPKTSLQV